MKSKQLLILILGFYSFISLGAQEAPAQHQLLWQISSPDLAHTSYLYGTMHIADERVFNFSDSLYLRIASCKNFALEIHPDSMNKYLIVDPFNQAVNNNLEKLYEDIDEELKEDINKELKERTGIELSNISEENKDLIPLLMEKGFKKNEDKNTFLDAHLYHIARILEKNIVGLESIDNHKKALKSNASETKKEDDKKDKGKSIYEKYKNSHVLENLIELYIAGDVDGLFKRTNYAMDDFFNYRNEVMIQSSIEYIKDGGLFMAVGAAHLSGEQGMIKLLQDKGFTVEPVAVSFTNNLINKELADKDLEWVREEYKDEGFSILIPDKAYNYLPESMAGIVKVRSYPDLGSGYFYMYAVVPVLVNNYNLDSLKLEVTQSISNLGARLKGDVSFSTYEGHPTMELEYIYNGKISSYRYLIVNNNLYSLGISKFVKGDVEEEIKSKYYNNVQFYSVEQKAPKNYIDEVGAFSLMTNLPHQQFNQEDDSDGSVNTNVYHNFFDQKNKLVHIVLYSYYEPGSIVEDIDFIMEGYKDYFVSEGDSLVYDRKSSDYGGREVHAVFADSSFVMAKAFARGNRLYQIFSTGAISKDNFELANNFITSFNIMSYGQYTHEPYENDLFATSFPATPIETEEDYTSLGYIAEKEISYRAIDQNTSMNVWVNEFTLSPYATYEHIDSCQKEVQELLSGYTDTIVNSSRVTYKGMPEFRVQLRNSDNQLDHQKRILLDGDKVYAISVLQDSAAISDKALKQFLDGFRLKTTTNKPSFLLRDSSLVRKVLLDDLTSPDSLISYKASEAISRFKFSPEILKNILIDYKDSKYDKYTSAYHVNMLQFLAESEVSGLQDILQPIYLNPSTNDNVQLAIIEILIEQGKEEAILLAKSLLQQDLPRLEDSWSINEALYENDDMSFLKPIIPELTELAIVDSALVLDYFFHDVLEQEIVDYEQLEYIHEIVETKGMDLYERILEAPDEKEQILGEAYNFMRILGFSDKNELAHNLANYFYTDTTSFFYQTEGGKCMLRSGGEVDFKPIFNNNQDCYYCIAEFYDIQKLFPQVNVLPDSLQTMSKFIEISSIAYLENAEYFDDVKIDGMETFEDDGHMHMYHTVTISYEGDSESYPVIIYGVANKNDISSLPTTDDIFVDYEFVQDKSIEDLKQKLTDSYESYKSKK